MEEFEAKFPVPRVARGPLDQRETKIAVVEDFENCIIGFQW